MRILQFLCGLAKFDLKYRGALQPVQPRSTARIRQDISAASFCSFKLLWRNDGDECVLLLCFNAQPAIFVVMNCCVVALSLFSSDILTSSTDGILKKWKVIFQLKSNFSAISIN